MDIELKKLDFTLENVSTFYCGIIISDNDNIVGYLKENLNSKVSFVCDCYQVEDIRNIYHRVISGEKIILSNLDKIYDIYAEGDVVYHDGINNFYQRFTESYRDRLWNNRKGQIYFVMSEDEYNQLYNPKDGGINHFLTMKMNTFEFAKEKIYRL